MLRIERPLRKHNFDQLPRMDRQRAAIGKYCFWSHDFAG
jgi:hypothetical protein